MAYTVSIRESAKKALSRVPRHMQLRIAAAIADLAETPRPVGVVKLSGFDHAYRIRVGDYRILYTIEDDRLVILVVSIAHRRDAYRGL